MENREADVNMPDERLKLNMKAEQQRLEHRIDFVLNSGGRHKWSRVTAESWIERSPPCCYNCPTVERRTGFFLFLFRSS